jgi:hypothetical protein
VLLLKVVCLSRCVMFSVAGAWSSLRRGNEPVGLGPLAPKEKCRQQSAFANAANARCRGQIEQMAGRDLQQSCSIFGWLFLCAIDFPAM